MTRRRPALSLRRRENPSRRMHDGRHLARCETCGQRYQIFAGCPSDCAYAIHVARDYGGCLRTYGFGHLGLPGCLKAAVLGRLWPAPDGFVDIRTGLS